MKDDSPIANNGLTDNENAYLYRLAKILKPDNNGGWATYYDINYPRAYKCHLCDQVFKHEDSAIHGKLHLKEYEKLLPFCDI